MTFNDREYTIDAILKQLGLVELHCKDGSALEAGCKCIETKHLYNIEGLSEEGVGFALNEEERKFFQELGDLSRQIRKRMEVENWSLEGLKVEGVHVSPKCLKAIEKCMKENPDPEQCRASVICH